MGNNPAPRFGEIRSPSYVTMVAAIAIAVAGWAATATFVAHHPFSFVLAQTPAAALEILQQRNAQRIFSTAPFGGYLMSRDVKVFIDGRAELYGEEFVMDYFNATEARNVGELLRLLDKYRIDATVGPYRLSSYTGDELDGNAAPYPLASWQIIVTGNINHVIPIACVVTTICHFLGQFAFSLR